VRPFNGKELPFVTSLKDSPQWICDGSLTATPQQKLSSKGIRRIVQVVDERVLIFDPPEENPITQYSKTIVAGGRKTKDMRYAFDHVFDEKCTQEDVKHQRITNADYVDICPQCEAFARWSP
jgi:kinesin family protein 18/19